MTAREYYEQLTEQIDQLQHNIKAGARSQVEQLIQLQDLQDASKRVMKIIIQDGDRPLLGTELVEMIKHEPA